MEGHRWGLGWVALVTQWVMCGGGKSSGIGSGGSLLQGKEAGSLKGKRMKWRLLYCPVASPGCWLSSHLCFMAS